MDSPPPAAVAVLTGDPDAELARLRATIRERELKLAETEDAFFRFRKSVETPKPKRLAGQDFLTALGDIV